MAEFSKDLLGYQTSFLQVNPSTVPEVACIFIGGSRLYNPKKPKSSENGQQSDYDGIIVVGSKYDIHTLVTNKRHRQYLLNMIGIKQEEEVNLHVPSPCSSLYSEWDGIRVSGFDDANAKRSVKILSLEHFNSGRQTLNILSGEDRRVYTNPHWNNGPSVTTLAQATTLDTGMLLHDQWLYKAFTDDRKVIGVFGNIVDLILTAACVYGRGHGQEIKRLLLETYASETGYYPSVNSFAQHTQFSPQFTDWLSKEFAELCPTSSDAAFIPNSIGAKDPIFVVGDTTKTAVSVPISRSSYIREIPKAALAQFNYGRVTRLDSFKAKFSRNSESYIVTTKPPGDEIDIFVKNTPYAHDELEGAKMAARFFHSVFVPRMARSGELVYPRFRGIVVHEARLAYIEGGRHDMALAESILYTELVRAEYTLRAHRSSLCLKPNAPAPRRNIQRFFHDRLFDDRRMREFYGQGMTLAGKRYSLDQLLSFRWVINGESCAPLRQAFDEARSILAPGSAQMLACPTVFGLGDSHGGNVMLRPLNVKGGASQFLFIDHEVAEVHPVMLDFAKPLYGDVFFESMYHDRLPKDANDSLKCRVDQDINTIFLDFKPKSDPLSQAILDIKVQYLIKPLGEEVEKLGALLEGHVPLLEEHVPLLTTALFLCSTVAANYVDKEEAFLRNFATALILREAKNWVEFVLQLEALGFKA